MRNKILKYFTLLLSVLVILIIYLSTAGIETDKFNDQIKKRILLINKKIDIDLKKIKLILDPFKLKIYAKTIGTTVYFAKRPLALASATGASATTSNYFSEFCYNALFDACMVESMIFMKNYSLVPAMEQKYQGSINALRNQARRTRRDDMETPSNQLGGPTPIVKNAD